jgi:ribosomal protein S18 acetylase RimI-like enzyme
VALRIQQLNKRRHDRNGFDCDVPALNEYLQKYAGQHRRQGLSTVFVLIDADSPAHILGYYTLSAAQIELTELTPNDHKRLPRYPLPCARMGRLAVDRDARGEGYGELLLQEAVKRALAAREQLGVYALVVDAKNEAAARFYRRYGFAPCGDTRGSLYLSLGK